MDYSCADKIQLTITFAALSILWSSQLHASSVHDSQTVVLKMLPNCGFQVKGDTNFTSSASF